MENKKLISIIMGVYNCENTIREAIDSILNQTYTNWELILCDDCSIDNTLIICNKYQKLYPKKIKVLENKKNMGLNYTLNLCLEEVSGEFVARMDGDDISVIERLEKQLNYLNANKNIALVGTGMEMFDENGIWGKNIKKKEPLNRDFLQSTPFNHATILIRTDILKKVKGYTVEKKLLRVEDIHLWIKIYMNGYLGHNMDDLLYLCRDDNNAYKRRKYKFRINEFRVRMYAAKNLKLGLKGYIYAFKPLIVGLLPKQIYLYLHKFNLK